MRIPRLSLAFAAIAARDRLRPRSFFAHIRPGHAKRFRAQVELAARPARSEPFDVLLLFDSTRSMEDTIEQVRDNAGRIMREIRARNPDSQFGVASFADYHLDPPWWLNQDITADAEAVSDAIARLRLVDGLDFPEAYSRALYESRFVGWRPGAHRYVVLFGDAPAHDPDFFGEDTGIDPGRDGVPGTADDLRFRDVVQQLREDGIAVVANYDPGDELASKGFEYVAAQTGGAAVPVYQAKEVPAAILAGLNQASGARPELSPPARYAEWVTVAPILSADRAGPGVFLYDVTLSVPPSTAAGLFSFPLSVRYRDAERSAQVGNIEVRIATSLRLHPVWRWLLLPLALLGLLLRGRRKLRQSSPLHLRGGAWKAALRGLARLGVLLTVAALTWVVFR